MRTFPGLQPALLQGALRAGVRGMLIEAFGAGNVPRLENSLIPVITVLGLLVSIVWTAFDPLPAFKNVAPWLAFGVTMLSLLTWVSPPFRAARPRVQAGST